MTSAGACPVACLHTLLNDLCRHLDEQRDAVQRVLEEIKNVLEEVDTAMVSCGQDDPRRERVLRDNGPKDEHDKTRDKVTVLTEIPVRRAG